MYAAHTLRMHLTPRTPCAGVASTQTIAFTISQASASVAGASADAANNGAVLAAKDSAAVAAALAQAGAAQLAGDSSAVASALSSAQASQGGVVRPCHALTHRTCPRSRRAGTGPCGDDGGALSMCLLWQ